MRKHSKSIENGQANDKRAIEQTIGDEMPKVILKNVRSSFLHVFEVSDQSGKFDATGLIELDDKANIKALKKGMKEAIDEKGLTKKFEAGKIRWKGMCLKAQDQDLVDFRDAGGLVGETEGKYREEFEGMLIVKASNATRPRVRDRDGKTDLIAEDGKPYSGCYVNLILDVWCQDNAHGQRVNANLLGVQFKEDGEAFSGGAMASDDDFDEDFEDEDDV